ncbi:hypothetical protein AB4K20DRAFT_1897171, partial [Rhizopus microsporus]
DYKFEASKPFNAINPRGKLRAVELLEEIATPYILLCTCSGSWGANLLIRYYWSDRRKKSMTPCHSPALTSAPSEDSNSSEER